MSKLRYNVNADILTMLYYSIIYPLLIYGVQVWDLTYPTHLKPVTTLQKRVAKIMAFSLPMSHSEPLLKSLNLLKFNDVIHSEILYFVYQWFHKLIPSCFFGFFQTHILHTWLSYTSVCEWKFIHKINSNYPMWYSLSSLHWFPSLELTVKYHQADNSIV